RTRLCGTRVTCAPLARAPPDGDDLRLAYASQLVKDAPHADRDGHLEPKQEETLYRHYFGAGGNGSGGDVRPDADTRTESGRRSTDDAMTRSEEELQVGTQKTETGRARLRKYVVTENESVTVPVHHEEVRIEREPI